MKEIEVKFLVPSLDEFREKIKKMGGRLEWSGQETSFFFDTPGQELKKKGKFIRLRKWDGHSSSLTLKVRPKDGTGKYKIRDEYQTEVSDLEMVKKILGNLGFVQIFSYTKHREHWKLEGACVELDNLGGQSFIEIEGSKKAINQLAGKLGLDWSESTTKSYFDIAQKIK